jgi:adenylate cyclase
MKNMKKILQNALKFILPLKSTIIISFSGIFILSMAVIILYGYLRSRDSLNQIGQNLMTQTTKRILSKTRLYLTPPTNIIKSGSSLISNNVLNYKSEEQMLKWFVSSITSFPDIYMLYFTHKSGYHVGVEQAGNKWIFWKFMYKNGVHIFEKSIYNKNLQLLKRHEEKNPQFNPRTRPWYYEVQNNLKPYWSKVYGFYSSSKTQQAGITLSIPVKDESDNFQGVIGVDINIKKISSFLSKIEISKTGLAIIIDNKDRVIAHPDFNQVVKLDTHKKTIIRNLNQIKPAWLSGGNKNFQAGNNNSRFETSNGENILLSRLKFPKDNFSPRWIIIVGAKDTDFIGSAQKTNRHVVIFSLIIFLLGLFGIFYLSRSLSKPIIALTRETNKIRSFKLDTSVQVNSRIKEIKDLDTSICSMKHSLKAFQRYVPKELVRNLLKTEQQVKVGGSQKELTIFFSDIKDFTTISEQSEPQFLMNHLSEYLEEMTTILIAHGATIDKYIGDAIMAFWNAPVDTPNHPEIACRAAIKCQQRLQELNHKWEQENKPRLLTRMGLTVGNAIVGNFGSSDRINYTILGDNVNLAARLEGINKLYGTDIMISKNTRENLSADFIAWPLDFVSVKGKENPVVIYELIGVKEEVENFVQMDEQSRIVTKAFEFYIQQEWSKAITELEKIPPDSRRPSFHNFMERCQIFLADPPRCSQ